MCGSINQTEVRADRIEFGGGRGRCNARAGSKSAMMYYTGIVLASPTKTFVLSQKKKGNAKIPPPFNRYILKCTKGIITQ
jgi:hypothetical protein